jgi:hypothetical protein
VLHWKTHLDTFSQFPLTEREKLIDLQQIAISVLQVLLRHHLLLKPVLEDFCLKSGFHSMMRRTRRGYDLYDLDEHARSSDDDLAGCQGQVASVCAEARSETYGLIGVSADLVGGDNVKVMAQGHGRLLCVQAWVCSEAECKILLHLFASPL